MIIKSTDRTGFRIKKTKAMKSIYLVQVEDIAFRRDRSSSTYEYNDACFEEFESAQRRILELSAQWSKTLGIEDKKTDSVDTPDRLIRFRIQSIALYK